MQYGVNLQGNVGVVRMGKLQRDIEEIKEYILREIQIGALRLSFVQHLMARYDFEIANGLNIEDLLDSLIAHGKIVQLEYIITNERFMRVHSVLFPTSVQFFRSSIEHITQF